MTGSSYSVASASRVCSGTGRVLCPGETSIAVLAQHRDLDDFVRLDFSDEAWASGARPDRSLVVLGRWRAVVGESGAKRRLLIDDDSLLELFEQSGESEGFEIAGADSEGTEMSAVSGGPNDDSSRLAFRFVLALILLRKRLLIQEDSRGTSMLVRIKGTPKPSDGGGVLIEVVDPGMTPALVARVTEQLCAVLSDVPTGGAA